MKNTLPDTTLRNAAVIGGIAILLMTIAAVVATDIAIGPLVTEDPATTIQNIQNELFLFRVGVLSWIVVLICDVVAAWGLYIFLRPVNKGISLISAWLRIVYTAILGTSILNLNHVLELLTSEYHLTSIGSANLESQSWMFLSSFDSSWSIGLLVFALHIFLLGYLSLKSNYVPKLLSVFLIIGSIGYFVIHLLNLLFPQLQNLIEILGWIFIIPMLSEVALGLWLLVKGKDITLIQSEQ